MINADRDKVLRLNQVVWRNGWKLTSTCRISVVCPSSMRQMPMTGNYTMKSALISGHAHHKSPTHSPQITYTASHSQVHLTSTTIAAAVSNVKWTWFSADREGRGKEFPNIIFLFCSVKITWVISRHMSVYNAPLEKASEWVSETKSERAKQTDRPTDRQTDSYILQH